MEILKTDTSVDQIAREVAAFLSEHIKIDKVILFGSHHYGIPGEDSDIDLAIISEDFEKMDLFSRAAIAVDSRVELAGFSKSQFLNAGSSSFLKVIKDKGKIIE